MTVRRNLRYAAGLSVLAPLVAETVASSNTPAILFPVLLPLLIVIYGLPVVLVRELWVRGRIGWPGFVVLGIAYTAFNEGVVASTWFKIEPDDLKVLAFTAEEVGRAHGINWVLVVDLSLYHIVWSLLVPLVLMAAWTGETRAEPWLPRWAVSAALGLVAFVTVGSISDRAVTRACEAPTQVIFDECARGRRGTALLLVPVIVLALALPRWRPAPRSVREPSGRVLVVSGIAYSVAFLTSYFVLPLSGRPGASQVAAIVLALVAGLAVHAWGRDPTWRWRAGVLASTGLLVPGMLVSLRAFVVLQPVAVALFAWFFLRKVHARVVAETVSL